MPRLRPTYALARLAEQPRRRGTQPHISDPVFREQLITLAATGMSRRGVAAAAGVPVATLLDNLSRGRAEPHVEPYGSFAASYLCAERGLEGAASHTEAMRVQLMREQMVAYIAWCDRGPAPPKPSAPTTKKPGKKASAEEKASYAFEQAAYRAAHASWSAAMLAWSTPPPHPNVADFEWLSRLKERRYPEDHGASKHRKPEPELTGAEWLEQHPLTHAQITEMLLDPPEEIRGPQVQTLGAVVRRELAEGWVPDAETAEALRAILTQVSDQQGG